MLILNKNILTIGGNRLEGGHLTPPTPPGPGPLPPIPANTIRVRTNDGNAPIIGQYTSYETATLLSGTTDVYDVYKSGTSFDSILSSSTNVTEIIGANTSGITDMSYMCEYCTSLTSIPLFDTSSVTVMKSMFYECSSLTSIPLFDTSNVTDIGSAFKNCYYVEQGALALYQQASTQTNPPSSHSFTFYRCGGSTTTGAAELAQIPTNWK